MLLSSWSKNFMHPLGIKNLDNHLMMKFVKTIVRGKKVHVTPRDICKFYNALYYENDFLENTDLTKFNDIDMDNIVKYLTEERGNELGFLGVCIAKQYDNTEFTAKKIGPMTSHQSFKEQESEEGEGSYDEKAKEKEDEMEQDSQKEEEDG
ncbi:hypothetical protein Goshw_013169 [Gossypium schwendimanii]|uniref:Uncharacterized protein n=1 Tax=Gossypium schwendimanii TaxID=34291 RepID=A0A7J9KX66_GOSSC|nr:hypothetical protein [Gossypium schwendimanii]